MVRLQGRENERGLAVSVGRKSAGGLVGEVGQRRKDRPPAKRVGEFSKPRSPVFSRRLRCSAGKHAVKCPARRPYGQESQMVRSAPANLARACSFLGHSSAQVGAFPRSDRRPPPSTYLQSPSGLSATCRPVLLEPTCLGAPFAPTSLVRNWEFARPARWRMLPAGRVATSRGSDRLICGGAPA